MLVQNKELLEKNEDYCFDRMDLIFNELNKNSEYKIKDVKMPLRYHYDAEVEFVKDDKTVAKYAIEIKQRNLNFDVWQKYGRYYYLTYNKLRHLQKTTAQFDKCLYLVLHLGKWSLFDLRKIDWSKVKCRLMKQKERQLDDDSKEEWKWTYYIPSSLAIKNGTYDIGDRP